MSERQPCTTCYTTGRLREREYVRCGCGNGRVFDFDRERICGSCGGSGGREQSVERPCYNCAGSGYRN